MSERNHIDPQAKLEEDIIKAIQSGDIKSLENLLNSINSPEVLTKILDKIHDPEVLKRIINASGGIKSIKLRQLISSRAGEIIADLQRREGVDNQASIRSLKESLVNFDAKTFQIEQQQDATRKPSKNKRKKEDKSGDESKLTLDEKFIQAVEERKMGRAAMLLSQGANINYVSKTGKVAAQIAQENGDKEVFNILATNYAKKDIIDVKSDSRVRFNNASNEESETPEEVLSQTAINQNRIEELRQESIKNAAQDQLRIEIMNELEASYQKQYQEAQHFSNFFTLSNESSFDLDKSDVEVYNNQNSGDILELDNDVNEAFNQAQYQIDDYVIEAVQLIETQSEALDLIDKITQDEEDKDIICSKYLAQAIREGNLQLISAIMSQPGFDANNSQDGESLFQIAKSSGNEMITSLLIAKGANTKVSDISGVRQEGEVVDKLDQIGQGVEAVIKEDNLVKTDQRVEDEERESVLSDSKSDENKVIGEKQERDVSNKYDLQGGYSKLEGKTQESEGRSKIKNIPPKTSVKSPEVNKLKIPSNQVTR